MAVNDADNHVVRSSCPFTNSLANHGYIPRNGLNASGDDVLAGMLELYNIDPSFTLKLVKKALSVSTTGNNNTFHLKDINGHNCTSMPHKNLTPSFHPRRAQKRLQRMSAQLNPIPSH